MGAQPGQPSEPLVKLPQIRVPESVHEALKRKAAENDRTLSAEMRHALRCHGQTLVGQG